jgi:hypothetical protein
MRTAQTWIRGHEHSPGGHPPGVAPARYDHPAWDAPARSRPSKAFLNADRQPIRVENLRLDGHYKVPNKCQVARKKEPSDGDAKAQRASVKEGDAC